MPNFRMPAWRSIAPASVVAVIFIFLIVAVFRGCFRAEKVGLPLQTQARLATMPWSLNERAELRELLDRHFAPILHSSKNGFVVLASDGSLLYDRAGSQARVPASTLKVLTAATALRVLGSGYRFTTRLAALHPIRNGILNGDLYLIGGGDPVLSSDALRKGVTTLHAMGLQAITGHVVVDTTAFVGPEQNPRWPADDLNLDYAAGTSALSLDENVEVFCVVPTAPGHPARVHLEPANPEALLQGNLISAGAGTASTVHIDHVQNQDAYRLRGQIGMGAEQRFPIPVGHVGRHVGGVLDGLLQREGINVLTPAHVEAAPLGAQTLWEHHSSNLADIVHHMLIVSDNHVAEQLLRTVASFSGHQGREAEGIAVEAALLTKLGVSDRGLRLYDGSGLSPADRIAPRSLAAVIADALATPGSPLIYGLPRVGIEGTVRGHSLKAAFGHVRAKSGHISGVDGLVGVVETPHHGTLVFAFITNDADDGIVEDGEDAVFDGLMRF